MMLLKKQGHFPFVAKLTREPSSCLCIKCCLTGASLSVDEGGMEDKTNCEPEGERDAKDHDDLA